jgi:hypothetical protein
VMGLAAIWIPIRCAKAALRRAVAPGPAAGLSMFPA